MDVCAVAAGDVEWGGGVRMWNVFTSEKGDVTVCAVDVFLYGTYAKVSDLSDAVCQRNGSKGTTETVRMWPYRCDLSAPSTTPLLQVWHRLRPFSPTKLPSAE
jgi:hypothetical protein